jgi:hypothetical protein
MKRKMVFPRSILDEARLIALNENFPEVLRILSSVSDAGLELDLSEAEHLIQFATVLRLKAGLQYPYWDDASTNYNQDHENCFHEINMGIHEKLQSYLRSTFSEL